MQHIKDNLIELDSPLHSDEKAKPGPQEPENKTSPVETKLWKMIERGLGLKRTGNLWYSLWTPLHWLQYKVPESREETQALCDISAEVPLILQE